MSYYFTDEEIDSLISEEKFFPGTIEEIMNFKESDSHKRASIELPRSDGSRFIIKLRQNKNDINDFSAIIAFQEKNSNKDFKLRRYNGKSHEHSNKLEGNKHYNFHIHLATRRYQDAGRKEESYAEETNRYSNIMGALKCLLQDCNVKTKLNPQTSIFDK
ncbi:hypothetical protein H8E88_26610 [candidate division KSB1 bacterium]|nr:hypothetical protein [candidate division KSB1 bacterium]